MKVKLKEAAGTYEKNHKKGDVVDVHPAVAETWIQNGIAEPVKEKK